MIECSPPKVSGNKFFSIDFWFKSEICFKALFIFLLILNGLIVFTPITLKGSQLSSSS